MKYFVQMQIRFAKFSPNIYAIYFYMITPKKKKIDFLVNYI